MRVLEGSPEPLGARPTALGLNIAVWSRHALAIEVCLFDESGEVETARLRLPGRTGPVFHGLILGVGVGARYGLRAHGPFAPALGHAFDPAKLLVDPHALRLDRPFVLHPSMFSRGSSEPWDGAAGDEADSGPFTPKAIVTDPGRVEPGPILDTPWGETVIYELHVKGFTRRHPDVPESLRGTFAGLGHPAAVEHLRRLGITCVELMPAAAWIDERHLPALGLTNYWGYNPVALMAPDPRLAPGGWPEVRAAVEALAAAGIETILDVVLNHSGEGDSLGPTVSARGLDNAAYYRLSPNDGGYLNDAGTGNTLALNAAPALRLAMDSLRAWRRLGGVHGFRFDLATVLGRGAGGFDPAAPLLAAIEQDPLLRGLKLIAEPWDCGAGGYQLGRFPPAWGEWNDRFRDTVRGFWRGDDVTLGRLASRLAGSEDEFAGRRPSRSVNFVVAHDGFTLADLVAFEGKHNLANGEENRDGTGDNRSWNNGTEGPTDDAAIRAARLADQRALLATLILARGTPMLAMGSEFGQTQAGNNNAYAQDNATGWLDWAAADAGLLDFTQRLLAIRREHPALRSDRFLTGEPASGGGNQPDVAWRTADGAPPTAAEWDDPGGQSLVMALAEPGPADLDRVVVAAHRGRGATRIVLPEPRDGFAWFLLADSADPARRGEVEDEALALSPRSVVVLSERRAPARAPRGVGDEALDRLAAAAGVAPDWSSVDGARRMVGRQTKRALLAAMALPAETNQQARDSLHALAEDHDRRPLPFALTGRAGHATTIRLAGQAGAPAPRTWLSVTGEDGARLRLRVGPGTGMETGPRCRDGRTARAFDLALPPLPAGRYAVLREDSPDHPCHLTLTTGRGHAPGALRGDRRLWGVSAQIYSLRRRGDQGVGDFTTLGAVGEAAAFRGASMLAINPLHSLFPNQRDRASPYYPSDRRFLDPLYLDVSRVPSSGEASGGEGVRPDPAGVDYPAVWARKSRALEASFADGGSGAGLDAFIMAGGDRLARFALFQAIAETRPSEPWRRWPAGLRDPGGPDARAFATAHAPRVRYHQYLQWLCERQLADAARRSAGLALGLCRDLAVGAAPDGAEIWAESALVASGVSIGAPPDPLGPLGQVWGLPPFDPHRLRADGYRAMAALFAANMRHAGALRIDHVMGLARQFWVPDGADGADGAYVAFPLADLLAVLTLESERAGCLVIGEDLGTVPEGLREALTAAGALSYRVLPFERDGPALRPPSAYPRAALACVATHDLPPLAGWWTLVDIDERQALGLMTKAEADAARAERAAEKRALLRALTEAGLLDIPRDPADPLDPPLAAAIHGYIAASNAALAVVQAEDLAGERVAVNLPGTDQERPNWRRQIAPPVEALFDGEPAGAIVRALRAARGPIDEPAPPPS
jgi:glycogen operon protein